MSFIIYSSVLIVFMFILPLMVYYVGIANTDNTTPLLLTENMLVFYVTISTLSVLVYIFAMLIIVRRAKLEQQNNLSTEESKNTEYTGQ